MTHRIAYESPDLFHTEQTADDLLTGYERPCAPVNAYLSTEITPARISNAFGAKWFGGLPDQSALLKLLADGWSEGAERVAGMARDLGIAVEGARSRKRRGVWSDTGDSLNIDRALRGQWDQAFRSSRRVWSSGTTHVDLMATWGGACNRKAEELFWGGAAMIVAADLLEAAGYRVRVIASLPVFHSRNGSHYSRHDVICKDYDQPLAAESLATVFCHAGVFRTLGFREITRCPWDVTSGFGAAISLDSLPDPIRPPEDGSIIMAHVFDRRAAIAEIQRVIARVQGESPETESAAQ